MDKSITAWRFWNLVKSNNQMTLTSVASGSFHWSKGLLKAECNRDLCRNTGSLKNDIVQGCPGLECTCGIYSYKTIQDLFDDVHTGENVIIGEVEIGGRVWEHEYGWRSQYGQISKIWHVPDFINKYNLPNVGSIEHPPIITGRFKRTVTESFRISNLLNMLDGPKVAAAYDCDLFDASGELDKRDYTPSLTAIDVSERVECIQTVTPAFRAGFMK